MANAALVFSAIPLFSVSSCQRTLLSLLLSLVMLASIAIPAAAEKAPEGKLYILHTNDMHGRAVADAQAGILGYAAIAQYKKDLEAQGHDVLLLDAGDATQGTPLVNLGMGKNAIEFMNAAGYMAMSPGNHEFDWGSDNLKQLAGIAKFPILSASILDAVGKEVTFKANTVFEMKAGLKVGVFGLTTPETATKAHPDKVRGVEFLQILGPAAPVWMGERSLAPVRLADVRRRSDYGNAQQETRLFQGIVPRRGGGNVSPGPASGDPAHTNGQNGQQCEILDHAASPAVPAPAGGGSLSPATRLRNSWRATRWLVPRSPRCPLSSRVSPEGNSSR